MRAYGNRRGPLLACAVAAGMAPASHAAAQDISLNYERLSSMEEPIAFEIGDVTVAVTGLLDAPLSLDGEDDASVDAGIVGNVQASALTQLQNRWRVSLTYFGQYTTDDAFASPPGDRYTDRAALSVGGVWGTVAGGNVSGIVREGTRRGRGAGNAALAFDDALGGLAEWGGGYTGRFGPWVVGAAVDEDADFEIGAVFRRPMDNTDYRLTLRIGQGVHAAADGSRGFDSTAIGAVGEVIYGSLSFDVGLGHERLASSGPDAERWYLSSGSAARPACSAGPSRRITAASKASTRSPRRSAPNTTWPGACPPISGSTTRKPKSTSTTPASSTPGTPKQPSRSDTVFRARRRVPSRRHALRYAPAEATQGEDTVRSLITPPSSRAGPEGTVSRDTRRLPERPIDTFKPTRVGDAGGGSVRAGCASDRKA